MKTCKILILLLVCVPALAVAGYFCLRQPDRRNAVLESAGFFSLTARTLDELTEISWTVNGETKTCKRKDGLWGTADSGNQGSPEAAEALAEQLVNLQATRKIENVSSLDGYGLAEPAVTVTAVWEDGSTVYSMGETTPFRDGYYLSLSTREDTVYTIASPLMAN